MTRMVGTLSNERLNNNNSPTLFDLYIRAYTIANMISSYHLEDLLTTDSACVVSQVTGIA